MTAKTASGSSGLAYSSCTARSSANNKEQVCIFTRLDTNAGHREDEGEALSTTSAREPDFGLWTRNGAGRAYGDTLRMKEDDVPDSDGIERSVKLEREVDGSDLLSSRHSE